MRDNVLIDPRISIFWEGEHGAGWCEPGRYLYDCELVYVSSGSCRVTTTHREFRLEAGDLLIIPPHCWHETWQPCRPKRHCVHFDWTQDYAGLASPLQVSREEEYDPALEHCVPVELRYVLPLYARTTPKQQARLQALFAALRACDPESALALWPVLRPLVTQNHKLPANKSARAVFSVKELIESQYRQELGFPDFCAVARLTRSHLCSIFSAQVGMSPMLYLAHVRLTHAERLLRQGGGNIAEIARLCGIADANYFARLFRKKFGVSPSRYPTHLAPPH